MKHKVNKIFGIVSVKMEALSRLVAGYHDLMDNKSDQRVKDWFLMSSPFPTLAICLTYVLTVKVSACSKLFRFHRSVIFL